jgi:hypothetical protein
MFTLMFMLLMFTQGYGRDIISAVGAEVDRIEAEIQVSIMRLCEKCHV